MRAPLRSPLSSKRRDTPGKSPSALAHASASKPASESPPRAASALATLWRPGTRRTTTASMSAPWARKRLPPSGAALISVASRSASGSRLARGCLEREPDHALALLPGEPDVRAGDHCRRRGSEGRERLRELGQRAPARVVIELQVGDHRDLRAQLQEACVALVGLGDDPIALSPAGVGGLAARSSAEQLTAEEEGGVGADAAQRPDAHRGRRRLAVGSRHGQQPALRAELGEELATMHHGLPALTRPDQLRVVLRNSGRNDHLRVRWDLVRVVSEVRLDSRGPQALHI